MKKLLLVLLIIYVSILQAQDTRVMMFKFTIDEQPYQCKSLKIDLALGAHHIKPKLVNDRFLVPQIFLDAYNNKKSHDINNVSVRIDCDGFSIHREKLYPVVLLPGEWKAGLLYPSHLLDRDVAARMNDLMWADTLTYACYDCDPGIVILQEYRADAIPYSIAVEHLDQLKLERLTAKGERARDIAYELTVYGFESQKNRKTLLDLHEHCIQQTDLPPDVVCDEKLAYELQNLHWRGDAALADILFNAVHSSNYYEENIDYFYFDYLFNKPEEMMRQISRFSPDDQTLLCSHAQRVAYSRETEAIIANLHKINSPEAMRCLQTFTSK
jgi:hypothetical protein